MNVRANGAAGRLNIPAARTLKRTEVNQMNEPMTKSERIAQRKEKIRAERAGRTPMHVGDSFDVTQVVGSVRISNVGDHSPFVAALVLIGEHTEANGNSGEFTFPAPNGDVCRVNVAFEAN
jgi:hypothetical protein